MNFLRQHRTCRWMSTDGQGTKCRKNVAENFNCPTKVHERYRQTDDRQTVCRLSDCNARAPRQTDRRTDGRATAISERERSLKTDNKIFLRRNRDSPSGDIFRGEMPDIAAGTMTLG